MKQFKWTCFTIIRSSSSQKSSHSIHHFLYYCLSYIRRDRLSLYLIIFLSTNKWMCGFASGDSIRPTSHITKYIYQSCFSSVTHLKTLTHNMLKPSEKYQSKNLVEGKELCKSAATIPEALIIHLGLFLQCMQIR